MVVCCILPAALLVDWNDVACFPWSSWSIALASYSDERVARTSTSLVVSEVKMVPASTGSGGEVCLLGCRTVTFPRWITFKEINFVLCYRGFSSVVSKQKWTDSLGWFPWRSPTTTWNIIYPPLVSDAWSPPGASWSNPGWPSFGWQLLYGGPYSSSLDCVFWHSTFSICC